MEKFLCGVLLTSGLTNNSHCGISRRRRGFLSGVVLHDNFNYALLLAWHLFPFWNKAKGTPFAGILPETSALETWRIVFHQKVIMILTLLVFNSHILFEKAQKFLLNSIETLASVRVWVMQYIRTCVKVMALNRS